MQSELPETELDNLCRILHREWPQSIQAINILRTCSEWKKKKPSLDMQILYNGKNIESGTFILINKSCCNVPLLTMYALDSHENELEEMFSHCLDKCEKIVALSGISKKHIPIVEKVIDANAYKFILCNNYRVYSMDMEKAKNLEISYPADVEAKPLQKEHLKDIREMSDPIVQYIFSLEDFENQLELNKEFAWGIFCKKTGCLLTRCMRSHDGSMCSMYTTEEARGKGYAKLLLKLISKKLAELSYVPYGFVDVYNEKSMRAVLGAGFHNVGQEMLAVIEKSSAPVI